MKIRVTSRFEVAGTHDLQEEIRGLVEALANLQAASSRVESSDVTAILSKRLVDVSAVIDAETWEAAQLQAEELFEGAIRKVGGRPRSDSHDEVSGSDGLSASIRSTELVPA